MSYTPGYYAASQIVSDVRSNSVYAWNAAASVNRSYAVNRLNQYTAVGSNAYSCDANGNLISNRSTSYGYDAEDRLISASNGANVAWHPLTSLQPK